MKLSFFFDAAVEFSRLGTAMGIGVAVKIDGEYYEDLSFTQFYPGWKYSDADASSSNVGEWLGLVNAFKLAAEYKEKGDTVEIYGDSQLIVFAYNGQNAIKKEKFMEYFNEAHEIADKAGLGDLEVKWVPREKNKEADKLSKIALKMKPCLTSLKESQTYP